MKMPRFVVIWTLTLGGSIHTEIFHQKSLAEEFAARLFTGEVAAREVGIYPLEEVEIG